MCTGYCRHSTNTISYNPRNKQPDEVGVVSDGDTAPGRLGDLPEVTQLGRGRARMTRDGPIPDLALATPWEQDSGTAQLPKESSSSRSRASSHQHL